MNVNFINYNSMKVPFNIYAIKIHKEDLQTYKADIYAMLCDPWNDFVILI